MLKVKSYLLLRAMKLNFVLVFILFAACSTKPDQHKKKCEINIVPEKVSSLLNGDILFVSSSSAQSEKIAIATSSPYTHCGIYWRNGDKDLVYEASSEVKLTDLNTFLKQSDNGVAIVMRYQQQITYIDSIKMYLDRQLGKPYDIKFEWSNDKMYCSELVFKAYMNANIQLVALKRLKQYDLTDSIVMKELKKRYGKHIPYNEPMVAPSDLFQSQFLDSIKEIQ